MRRAILVATGIVLTTLSLPAVAQDNGPVARLMTRAVK